jgi:hypothetical protein
MTALEVTINGRAHRFAPASCRCGWTPNADAPTWNAHVFAIINTLNDDKRAVGAPISGIGIPPGTTIGAIERDPNERVASYRLGIGEEVTRGSAPPYVHTVGELDPDKWYAAAARSREENTSRVWLTQHEGRDITLTRHELDPTLWFESKALDPRFFEKRKDGTLAEVRRVFSEVRHVNGPFGRDRAESELEAELKAEHPNLCRIGSVSRDGTVQAFGFEYIDPSDAPTIGGLLR